MKVDALNGAAAVLAVALGGLLTVLLGVPEQAGSVPFAHVSDRLERVPDVIDARGHRVPTAPYERIVSLHPVADHLLLRLVEPERLIAITEATGAAHPGAWRFGDRHRVQRGELIETTLSLSPGLVIASALTDESLILRLREAGVPVFDLGEMRGVQTTKDNIRTLGQLLHSEERALALGERYARDLRALELSAPPGQHLPGLYLSVFGDSLFGGTRGTSFADLLRLGGVQDIAAADGFMNWPQYSAEELITLAPRYIVTQEGMARVIRAHAVLRHLPAAMNPAGIIEIPAAYNSDAGLGLVEAGWLIQAQLRPSISVPSFGAKEGAPTR